MSVKTFIHRGFAIAMFDYWRVICHGVVVSNHPQHLVSIAAMSAKMRTVISADDTLRNILLCLSMYLLLVYVYACI